MTKDEALKLALRSLKELAPDDSDYAPALQGQRKRQENAITAIKQALAAPVQEPVAWATREDFYRELEHAMNRMRQQMEIKSVTMRCTDYYLALPIIDIFDGRILVGQVTTPPQRKPLTDDEIWKNDDIMAANSGYGADFETLRKVIWATEAAHGIKETEK